MRSRSPSSFRRRPLWVRLRFDVLMSGVLGLRADAAENSSPLLLDRRQRGPVFACHRSPRKLLDLVAPTIPALPVFTRKEIGATQTWRALADHPIELVGLAA